MNLYLFSLVWLKFFIFKHLLFFNHKSTETLKIQNVFRMFGPDQVIRNGSEPFSELGVCAAAGWPLVLFRSSTERRWVMVLLSRTRLRWSESDGTRRTSAQWVGGSAGSGRTAEIQSDDLIGEKCSESHRRPGEVQAEHQGLQRGSDSRTGAGQTEPAEHQLGKTHTPTHTLCLHYVSVRSNQNL